jgi:pimeloyl-ACP methyl ester carboxylesterase
MSADNHGSTATTFAGLAADDRGHSDDRPPVVLLHGLTFDRTMWLPALAELDSIDPDRRVVAFDLPGHGRSSEEPPYDLGTLVERVHAAVLEAGLIDPVVVGHSQAAAIASLYAAEHQARGVIAVEGTLRIAGFAAMARSLEPVLRGPGFAAAWSGITANVFRLDEVSPSVREMVNAMASPRQEIVLGYWQDVFERTPAELDAWVTRASASIAESRLPYVVLDGRALSQEDEAWLKVHLPDAWALAWPHSGHFPQLAHPRLFAELLAETDSWARGSVSAPVSLSR